MEDFVLNLSENGVYTDIHVLEELIKKYDSKRPFVIMGKHMACSEAGKYIRSLVPTEGLCVGVTENPTEESVKITEKVFAGYGGDLLISVGGGSAMDTAKAVKYRLNKSELPHICIPTTAGSGSEATQYAVICINGAKYSISDDPSLLPENAILDSSLLCSMSPQQKKVSLLDALCHSIESLISCRSTDESIKYADYAVKTILNNYQAYINEDQTVYNSIFQASYFAGKAIAITRTSIGHSLSYTFTTDYGIQHGQAVAVCLISAFNYAETDGGRNNLFSHLYDVLECSEGQGAGAKLLEIYNNMKLKKQCDISGAEVSYLASKVNLEKLSNCLFKFDDEAVRKIYAATIEFML